jgi:hypothetical protein
MDPLKEWPNFDSIDSGENEPINSKDIFLLSMFAVRHALCRQVYSSDVLPDIINRQAHLMTSSQLQSIGAEIKRELLVLEADGRISKASSDYENWRTWSDELLKR